MKVKYEGYIDHFDEWGGTIKTVKVRVMDVHTSVYAQLKALGCKRVRVTIETIPDNRVKADMPVCYTAMGVA